MELKSACPLVILFPVNQFKVISLFSFLYQASGKDFFSVLKTYVTNKNKCTKKRILIQAVQTKWLTPYIAKKRQTTFLVKWMEYQVLATDYDT